MTDLIVDTQGRAGRLTLNRPKALNALTYDMVLGIEKALDAWAEDDRIQVVLIDAAGDKAFCAGGDIQKLYETGREGDFAYGRTFWTDEYRLNAKLARYGKPIVSFLHGFVMGGGVGIGCHVSHRIVDDSSQIAMPETGIGLVPDVGGSLLLARAPGRLGDYLGLTAARMSAGDALRAGFADHYVPHDRWDALKTALCESGAPAAIAQAEETAPAPRLAEDQETIDGLFASGELPEIAAALRDDPSEIAQGALKAISRNSPLSMACTLEMLARLRAQASGIEDALALEYRYTARSMQHGDFLEGIRAAIIDKDRNPAWQHGLDTVPQDAVDAMLAPLDDSVGELKI